jgi:diketogulonate reductase-like aldo/keto reductase
VQIQGVSVPSFLYGTAWKEERTDALTRLALAAGFRGIDTANQRRHYVEAAAGDAVAAVLEQGEIARGDLFLQTKFTSARGQDHRLPYDAAATPERQVEQSFDSSLAHLRTTYVDSYVLHGPETSVGLSDTDWRVWRAIEALQRDGRARLIGVSNVTFEQLEGLLAGAAIIPALVQNRCYASTGWDREVRTLCAAHGIGYQGFSLLTANRRELASPTARQIAERYDRTLPQIVFRFAIQVGMIPLTGTSSAQHMAQDLAASQFELDEVDVQTFERIAG